MDLRRIDLNLLVVLDTILAEQHITRAAARLDMSQPAVSNAVNRLRRMLDDPLLVRTGRTLQTTPYADALRPKVRSILADIEQTLTTRPTFEPASDARTFSIAATDYITVILLRHLVGMLAKQAPNIRLVVGPVHEDYTSQLRQDRVDLLFLPQEIATSIGHFPGESIFVDHFVLAMCREHPARGTSDPLSLLADEPYLAWRAHGPNSFVDQHLDRLGIARREEMATESLMTAPFLLRGTRLVTMLHARLARELSESAGIAFIPLPLDLPTITQRMYWHSRRTDDVGHQWVRRTVREVAHELRGED
ncbi:LysR substrate-binding domain-containing protein [Micromonospora sp. NPDC048830]|uniref:LysR substrate-binding domain-containing protein n=1 Tax=Micromonospora sp. NPDC048830 TaxID=3364257 RepID=UPI00371CE130